ncbi:dienelactone hydrolase family protein [Labrenzia sp. PHM005]|uniref:dienelactone hydrolase family protein n=1 Tax=Labrenzia sp. PHM005 TaxID=2590016 RepID=UPI001140115B|nr:dienelactone hydrolase family protein [Labrenzia sp. PHM005]QDG75059.1 hypothetical protein FJ695_03810 [Labrenzia sp. PHM005]
MKRISIIKTAGFALIAGLFLQTAPASAGFGFDVVHFSAAAMPGGETTKPEPENQIWGHLKLPSGQGPHPAIVLMHGCSGIQQSHFDWAHKLNDAGFAALIVDSFRPRSIVRQCGSGIAAASPSGRVLDAYGALQYLSRQSDIDADRIGLIGWSHGGIAALSAVSENGIGERFPETFQSVAAFYPYCITGRTFFRPVSILIGEEDDWTPAADCQRLKAGTENTEHEVDLTLLPGATHAFDNPDVGDGIRIPGDTGRLHWLKYAADAHQTAIQTIKVFFDEKL